MKLSDAHNHAHELADAGEWPPCVVNGTSPTDWGAVSEFAAAHAGCVTPSFGLHPWFIEGAGSDWATELRRRLEADPSAAVGECGLDKTRRSPGLDLQEVVFREQIQIAREYDRAISVHCVRAWGRLLDVLRSEPLPARGVLLHSFAAPMEMVGDFVAIERIYFSLCFAGRVAPGAALVRVLPLERMLIESDATAESGREPGDVVAGYRPLAEWRGEPLEDVASQISANFARLFLPPER